MPTIRSICVYCAASQGARPEPREAATALGALIADRGWRLVYGGGQVGLMGLCAEAALAGGAHVTGIIPDFMSEAELVHTGLSEVLVVDSMHTRKRLMAERADAFVVLPGGFGTLDETFEILTWRQLRLHAKPIVLVNVEGYWDPLLALLDAQMAAGFVRESHRDLFTVVPTVWAIADALVDTPDPPGTTRLGLG